MFKAETIYCELFTDEYEDETISCMLLKFQTLGVSYRLTKVITLFIGI
jgi:hypothetical protein